ncbi:hypothetical protein [Timonella sp. A28]|uniref:hypothetical protein n=1 Tax=Timonella sp. A28 TaxID=3442640 RepID=UPI003EB7B6AD
MVEFSPHLWGWLEAFLYVHVNDAAPQIPRAERDQLMALVPDFMHVQRPDFTLHPDLRTWFENTDWQTRFLTIAGEQSRIIGGASEPFKVPASSSHVCEQYTRIFSEILRSRLDAQDGYHLTRWAISLEAVAALNSATGYSLVFESDSSNEKWWTTPNYLSPPAYHITYSHKFSEQAGLLSYLTCAHLYAEDLPDGIPENIDVALHTAAHTTNKHEAPVHYDNLASLTKTPVYRIESRTDFVDLVTRFPLHLRNDINHTLKRPETTGTPIDVIPNWAHIAQHYAGVFVTAEAFLLDTWVPLSTPLGTTIMTGWAPETFYRLQ